MKQQVFTNKALAIKAIQDTPDDAKVQFVIRDRKNQRSIDQNNLYWFWVDILAKHTGEIPSDMSFQLKEELLIPKIIETLNGGKGKQYPSTASMSVKELQEYLDAIDIWCIAFCGFALPKTIYTETR